MPRVIPIIFFAAAQLLVLATIQRRHAASSLLALRLGEPVAPVFDAPAAATCATATFLPVSPPPPRIGIAPGVRPRPRASGPIPELHAVVSQV